MNFEAMPGYGTFSGADMQVSLVFPGATPIVLGQASTISYSILRDKGEVRTLGRISVKGFTKGQRRVAGQIIFTVINRHVVEEIKERIEYLRDIPRILLDELPPFDIMVTVGNEYGHSAFMIIYGATLVHEGKVMSIENMITENTVMYLARDIRPLGSQFGSPVRFTTNLRDLDELLGKFKVDELASESTWERWQEAKEELMQSIVASQVNEVPPTPPAPPAPPPVSLPSPSEYKLTDVKLKVIVRDEDGHGLEQGKVRIWVPYKHRAFPPEPDFFTCGDDYTVEYSLVGMPIYSNPHAIMTGDIVNIRARAPGCDDATREIHLSEHIRNGVVVVNMSLRASTGSFIVDRVRPSESVVQGDMNYNTVHCVRLYQNGHKAPGEKVTWIWRLDKIENTFYPGHLTRQHMKDGITGSDGVSTFDIIAEIRKVYPAFELLNGVEIKLSCLPVRGGLPATWVIKSKPGEGHLS